MMQALGKHVRSVQAQIRAEFAENIYDQCGESTTTFLTWMMDLTRSPLHQDDALKTAADEANKTVARWGRPVDRYNRAAGGYYYATYKAICRRNGVFSNAQGPHDWNAAMIEPIIKAVSTGWEKTFSRRIQSILTAAAVEAGRLLKSFHQEIEREASRFGPVASLQLLSHQLQNYQALLKDICNESTAAIVAEAKEINRMFQPVIADALAPAYLACTEERGKKSSSR